MFVYQCEHPPRNDSTSLKSKLGGELQDSRAEGRVDLAERGATETGCRIAPQEEVRQIEGFRANFHCLPLPYFKKSGERRIDFKLSWSEHTIRAHIAQRP